MFSIAALRYRFGPRSRGPWRSIEQTPLGEFIILSMLLHAIAILLFGAPSGGSPHGRAIWGSLQVVIRERMQEPTPTLKIDRGGLGISERATVTPPRPTPAPVAAPLPTPITPPVGLSVTKELLPPPEAAPPAPPAPPPETTPSPQPRVEPPKTETFVVPPLMDRIVAPERRPVDILPAPPIELPVSPAPPPEAKPVPVPVVPAPVIPKPEPIVAPPAPAPLERITAPRIERMPAEAPTLTAPLVEPKAPPVVEPPPMPVTQPVETKPVEAPPVPVPVTPPVEKQPVQVPPVPVTPERVSPIERPPVEVPAVPVPPTERSRGDPSSRPDPRDVPSRTPPPSIDRPDARSPDRDSRPPAASPFKPGDPVTGDPYTGRLRPPASDYDPFGPKELDLDAARRRAREIAREGMGNRAPLPFPMPAPPEKKTKEQIAIENARKPDCNTAWAGLGLLAVVPLVANEFGEGNCRWR